LTRGFFDAADVPDNLSRKVIIAVVGFMCLGSLSVFKSSATPRKAQSQASFCRNEPPRGAELSKLNYAIDEGGATI
jgi:hypothetical protein